MAKKEFAVADCETNKFDGVNIQTPICWGIQGPEGYKEFWGRGCTARFVNYCRDKAWTIYAHNGGRFDFVLPDFQKHIPADTPLMMINGRLVRFKIGEAEFRDSLCILPVPLKFFQKDEFDYDLLDDPEKNKRVILKYLKSDCDNLHDVVAQFREDYGTKLTLASSALNIWRDMGGVIPDGSYTRYQQVVPWYAGGRVEVFKGGIHKGPIDVYDINSAYPMAMVEQHPYGALMTGTGKPDTIEGQGFYLVNATSKGALPHRADGKLSFPHRTGEFYATGWELLAGQDTGTVRVHKYIEWRRPMYDMTFKPYVERFYELKKNSIGPERMFAKLFLNSLYGKMAANPTKYKNYRTIWAEDLDNAVDQGKTFSGFCGEHPIVSTPQPESSWRFYDLGTAASITGFVRAYLWRAICTVRVSGGEILYCDTDSIFCKGGRGTLALGDELGQWNLEGTFREGAFAGKKLYALRNGANYKTASKGARLTGAEIFRVARGQTVRFNPEAPTYGLGKIPRFNSRQIKATAQIEG